MQKLFGENDSNLHENRKLFSYQWLCTQPHFETGAWGNSEAQGAHTTD